VQQQQHKFDLAHFAQTPSAIRGSLQAHIACAGATQAPPGPRRAGRCRIRPEAPQRRRSGPAARNVSVVPTTGRPSPRSSGQRRARRWQRGGCNSSFQYGAIQEQPSCDIVAQGLPPQPGTRGHAARAHLTAHANGRPPRAASPRQPAARAGSGTVAPHARRCPAPPAQGLLSCSWCRALQQSERGGGVNKGAEEFCCW